MTAAKDSEIMDSDILEPINLGSSKLYDQSNWWTLPKRFAGIKLKRNCDLSAPKGEKREKQRQYTD